MISVCEREREEETRRASSSTLLFFQGDTKQMFDFDMSCIARGNEIERDTQTSMLDTRRFM